MPLVGGYSEGTSALTSTSSTNTGGSNNVPCQVYSPLDGSCGFVVNPPPWAANFSALDHPVEYFDNGSYGIIWLNSTSFRVINPVSIAGKVTKVIPAACIITAPNATIILSATPNAALMKLPNGQVVSAPIPSYAFCPIVSPASTSAALGRPSIFHSATDSTSQSTVRDPVFADYATDIDNCWGDNVVNCVRQISSQSNGPQPPETLNCGSSCPSPLPYVYSQTYIWSVNTGDTVGGEYATEPICTDTNGGVVCTFYMELVATYTYSGTSYVSYGPDVSPGDYVINNPANYGGSNPYVCGIANDYTQSQSVQLCGYLNGVTDLNSFALETYGMYYTCANYPGPSGLDYYQVNAINQNGAAIYIGFNPGATGKCGPYSSTYGWLCDSVAVSGGYTPYVYFQYDNQNPGVSGSCPSG